jgi:hypothetical protein
MKNSQDSNKEIDNMVTQTEQTQTQKYYGVRKYKHRYDWLKARFTGERLATEQRKLSTELIRNEEICKAAERISFWIQTDKTLVLEMILDAYKTKYDNDYYGASIKTKVKHAADVVMSDISIMSRARQTDLQDKYIQKQDKEPLTDEEEVILAEYEASLEDPRGKPDGC